MPGDYYKILGVARDASESELKKAYRQLAMQCHPDRNPGDKQAEERFKECSEAYAVLSDPDKRAHYDRFGTVGPAGGFGDTGFGTLFEDIFETVLGGGGRGSRTRAFAGEDLEYELKITLEEAAKGVETDAKIARLETCEGCQGTGAEPGSRPITCPTCRGRGQVASRLGPMTVARTCPTCFGDGEQVGTACKTCKGEKRQPVERTVPLKIPPGIEQGHYVLRGQGYSGVNGGPAGDLIVRIRVREHEVFARNGADLLCDLPVTFPQLARGTEIEVPVLGATAKLKVPAGSQPHQILKLRGKGMPRLRERGQGDACYRLILEVPHKLNAGQREALDAFDEASKDHGGPLLSSFLERMKKLLE